MTYTHTLDAHQLTLPGDSWASSVVEVSIVAGCLCFWFNVVSVGLRLLRCVPGAPWGCSRWSLLMRQLVVRDAVLHNLAKTPNGST